MIARRHPIVIEPTGTGYSAYSPDVDGCVAVGDSEGETRQNFQDALHAHFEAMREIGEPIQLDGTVCRHISSFSLRAPELALTQDAGCPVRIARLTRRE